jgi:hypothetical protein
MTMRIVVHGCYNVKSSSLIKLRRLEAVRRENDLLTLTTAGFFLECPQQPCPYALAAQCFLHPKLTDLTATAPRVPTDSRNNALVLASHENCQALAILDPGRARVELIEAIFQALNLFRRGIRLDNKI